MVWALKASQATPFLAGLCLARLGAFASAQPWFVTLPYQCDMSKPTNLPPDARFPLWIANLCLVGCRISHRNEDWLLYTEQSLEEVFQRLQERGPYI